LTAESSNRLGRNEYGLSSYTPSRTLAFTSDSRMGYGIGRSSSNNHMAM